MANDGLDHGICVFRGHFNRRIPVCEDPEYFVRKALSDRRDLAKVEHDLTEFLQIGQETPGFGSGHIVAPEQFDKDLCLLKLETVFLRGEFVEHLRKPAPGAPVDHEVNGCAGEKSTLGDEYVVLPAVPLDLADVVSTPALAHWRKCMPFAKTLKATRPPGFIPSTILLLFYPARAGKASSHLHA